MADESMELEDGQLVMNGPSAAGIQQRRALLDRAVTMILRYRGQEDLARLAMALVELDLRDAMRVLNDEVRGGAGEFSGDPALLDAFRHWIRADLLSLQTDNFSEHEISLAILRIVLDGVVAALLRLLLDNHEPHRGGGFGAVRASAAAVRSLEKQTFLRAGGNESVTEGGCGITECSICFDEFVDGEQVSVMPCPSHGHRFHPDCIVKWLGISNTCPLCRHVLPAH